MRIDPRLLARFDADARQWRIAADSYKVRLANDAADPGIRATLDLPASSFAS